MAFVGALRTYGAPVPLTWLLGFSFHARMNSIREGLGDGSRARNPFAVMARLAPRAGANMVMREAFRYALACNNKRGSLGLLALSIHMSKRLAKSKIQPGSGGATLFHCAPQPNWGFNADTNSGHAFGIFMPAIGTLQPSASGAG